MSWGIPRSSLDYSWGRKAFGWDREEEMEVQPDIVRDYCPVCDKKSVHQDGMCLGCSILDNNNR